MSKPRERLLWRQGDQPVDMASVFRHMRVELSKVERALIANLQSTVPPIAAVAKHITLSGGKRLRPAVLLLSADACGYAGPRRTLMAVVTEYIHTATLLHDDVVDVAHVRRGRPAANVVFGNAVSVLVGDYLLARASDILAHDGDFEVLGIYARALVSLCEGEVLQLTKSGDPRMSERDYLRVAFNKTASLLAAASETGAVLAGAGAARRRWMFEFGKAIGTAFQLADDILDYTGTEAALGKRPRQDLREATVTLPLIYALRRATAADRTTVGALLAKPARSERDILFLARFVERHGGIEYTARAARLYAERGKRALAALPESNARAALVLLSNYIVSRST